MSQSQAIIYSKETPMDQWGFSEEKVLTAYIFYPKGPTYNNFYFLILIIFYKSYFRKKKFIVEKMKYLPKEFL